MSRKHILKEGTLVSHFKGRFYRVLGVAENVECGELVVVYKDIDGSGMYIESIDDFLDKVDKTKYPEITRTYIYEEVEC